MASNPGAPPPQQHSKFWSLPLLVLASLIPFGANAQKHAFDVRDSIEMVRFTDPSDIIPGSTAKYSPDGKHFVCITTRGVVSSNQVESTVWVFSELETRRYLDSHGTSAIPRPVRVVTIATRVSINAVVPYAPVIEDIRWTQDSRSVLFLVQRGNEMKQLYRASILSHQIDLISSPGENVQRYDSEGNAIVYTTSQPRPAVTSERALRSDPGAVMATGASLSALLFNLESADPGDCELWVYRNRQRLRLHSLNSCWPDPVSLHLDPFSLSPDGHFLAWLNQVRSVPESWAKLKPKAGFAESEQPRAAQSEHAFIPQNVRQYAIFDVRSGKTAALIDAPYAFSWGFSGLSYAIWSPDGRGLAITDVFLPKPNGQENSQASAPGLCQVAIFAVVSKEIHCLISSVPGQERAADYGPYHLNRIQWANDGADLIAWFRNTRLIKRTRCTEGSGRWRTIEEKTVETMESPESGIDDLPAITVDQRFDDGPPSLWISDARHSGLKLWDPNPQFSQMTFGKASLYEWIDKSGRHWTAGLVLPVGYHAGEKYPLVIQTHGVWDKMFMTDGCFPTAMAARPLASAGFVVLQIGSADPAPSTGTPTEADEADIGIDGAIDKLTSDGLIDASRIGITGFSRTSWYVETELVKHPGRFAAAIIADGIDEGYLQYILFSDGLESLRRESERINIGAPFGSNLNKWLESSVTFHLDQLATPLRVEAHGPQSLLAEWQIYASLRLQDKPTDLVYFLGEQHILQNPADRLVSQQGAVDWYRFWLKGEEDPDLQKKGQYERWEALRAKHGPRIFDSPSVE